MCIGHSAYVLLSFIISLRSMGSLRISKLSMKMESMNKIRRRHVDFRCKILAILQGDEHCFFFMLCFYWHFAAVDLGPCLRNERVVWCFLTRFHRIGVNRFNLSDAGWCTCLKVWRVISSKCSISELWKSTFGCDIKPPIKVTDASLLLGCHLIFNTHLWSQNSKVLLLKS